MSKIKPLLLMILLGILIYTRFINLSWGLPYPMHPDERNMANAIQGLNCGIFNIKECLNPHFFAYGQFPLYLGYLIVWIMKFFDGDLLTPIGFDEATMALRLISAAASVLNVIVLIKIVEFLIFNSKFLIKSKFSNFKPASRGEFQIINLTILIFSPYFIQFSHFGTTESLLMLFYSISIYFSMKLLSGKLILNSSFLILTSIFSGLALATKISAGFFLVVPIIAVLLFLQSQGFRGIKQSALFIIFYSLFTIIFTIIFSPHNLINLPDFLSAIKYESDVATGRYVAFYTQQFTGSIPVVFQTVKIFPYALGWPQFILFLLGFFFLSWKDKRINLLRFAFLIYFVPSAFLFAKWTRFMAPILPTMSVFAILMALNIYYHICNRVGQNQKLNIKDKKPNTNLKYFYIFGLNLLFFIFYFLFLLHGISYLSVYHQPDTRFQASEWIYKNIPGNSLILSETANVINLPLPSPNLPTYNYIPFDFYHLDEDPTLKRQLDDYLKSANYIIVPSRRIFANYSCYFPDKAVGSNNKRCRKLEFQYPLLNTYYQKLFDGSLGFKQVAEFKILNDEQAEETWSVFDHPVVRIYKREIPNSKLQIPNNIQ